MNIVHKETNEVLFMDVEVKLHSDGFVIMEGGETIGRIHSGFMWGFNYGEWVELIDENLIRIEL